LSGLVSTAKKALSSWAEVWEHFLFAPVDAAPLAALRIVFGLYLVVYYVDLYWLLDLYLSPPGLLPRESLPRTAWAFVLRLVPYTPWACSALVGLAILSAVGLAVGLNTRTAAALGWILNRVFSLALVGRNSGDHVVSVLAFLFLVAALLGHAQRVWSLDARQGKGASTVPAVCLRLFQIQLVLVYFFSGFHKLASPDWYKGEAIYYVFEQAQWLRFDGLTATHPLLVGLSTYGVLLFELVLFPVLVWPRATRSIVLFLGVGLHLGIALSMRVFVFGEIMPIFYLCFVEPRGVVARVKGLIGPRLSSLRRSTRA
jgi:hypothetical protein